jgi:hypothetical protein
MTYQEKSRLRIVEVGIGEKFGKHAYKSFQHAVASLDPFHWHTNLPLTSPLLDVGMNIEAILVGIAGLG